MENNAEVEVHHPATKKERCSEWMKSPAFSVYVMKALSSWGDRMWMFAVGLYLVKLSNITLTLTAIYGLTGGVCVILLGALVGDWVDRNPRLKVARTSLVIQNSAVIVCAVILCFVLIYYQQILTIWPVHLANICSALVIGTAVVSKLASIATKIAVEKDWVVVMAGGNKDKLSTMNASMRRIDLLCNILSPALVGQVMTFASMVMGAVVIAGWNLISVFLEYYLLWKIYKAVPDLAVKKGKGFPEDKIKARQAASPADEEKGEAERLVEEGAIDGKKIEEKDGNPRNEATVTQKKQKSLVELVFGRFITLYKGWGVYLRQKVLPAGIAFSCEFMTILAFDNITSGFAFSQGLAEYVIGLLMAAGAVTGIAGTFVFPVLRRRIGLERTGLVAFVAFISCLTLCVASIWAPGSPFDPTFSKSQKTASSNVSCALEELPVNLSTVVGLETRGDNSTSDTRRPVRREAPLVNSMRYFERFTNDIAIEAAETVSYLRPDVSENLFSADAQDIPDTAVLGDQDHSGEKTVVVSRQSRAAANQKSYGVIYTSDLRNGTPGNCSENTGSSSHSYFSIGLLMAGIVSARFGLWLSDLTITQVFQENVAETERGVVGGVQSSLNMLMDVIRYAMVVIAPHPETYGILIIISFLSICTGACLFVYYVRKVQGYFCVEACPCTGTKSKSVEGPKEDAPVTEL